MANLVPVDYDPFAAGSAPEASGATLIPVDHDPFADQAKATQQQIGVTRSGGIGDTFDAAIRGVADIATAGFADEISAALGAATGIGGTFGDYDGNLRAQRGIDRFDEQHHPAARIGGQVAGGIGTGLGLAKNGVTLMRGGLSGAQLMGRAAAEGAAYGAAQGFGSGEGGVTERAKESLNGAITGAAFGSIAAGAARGIGTLVQGVKTMRGTTPAQRQVLRDLERDGVLPAEIKGRLERLGPEGMLADTSEGLRLRAEQLAQSDNAGRSTVIGALKQRSGEAKDRISNAYDAAMGENPDVYQTMKGQAAAKKARADELYGAARAEAGPVDVSSVVNAIDAELQPGVNSVSSPGSPSQFMDEAEKQLAWVRSKLTDGKSLSTDFDRIHGLQQQIGRKIDALKGRDNYTASVLIGVRRQLLGALDTAAPTYSEARRTFSSDSAVQAAFDRGRKIFEAKEHPDFLRAEMADMSAAERDAMRLGVRAAADGVMGKVKNGALSGRDLLRSDWNERKVMDVLGPDKGRALIQSLIAEQEMAATANQVMSGSATARRMDNPFKAQPNNSGPPNEFVSLLNIKAGDAAKRAWDRIIALASKSSADKLAKAMAQMLTAKGPDRSKMVASMLEAAAKHYEAQAAGRATKEALRTPLIGASASQAPALSDRARDALSGPQRH